MTDIQGPIARVERYGATSVVELIVFDLSVKSYDVGDLARAEHLARQINARAAERGMT